MEITKEMGRACLANIENPPDLAGHLAHQAFNEMGWTEYGEDSYFESYCDVTQESVLMLTMAATIAGVIK